MTHPDEGSTAGRPPGGPEHAARAAAWARTALEVELPGDLLGLALTHRSFAYENGGLPTNERLEFLGDSVLGLVVTDELYRSQPDLPEGQLAKLRASVVNMTSLAGVARRLGDGGVGPRPEVGHLGPKLGEVLPTAAQYDLPAASVECVSSSLWASRGLP